MTSLGCEVAQVFTLETDNKLNFNEQIVGLCEERGIPYKFGRISQADIEAAERSGVSLIIAAGYPYKVPCKVATRLKCINIHPAFLPEGRGPWPLPAILMKGHSAGITIHEMTENFDAGDILIQEKIELNPDENLETLSCRSQMLARCLIRKLFSDFDSFWNGKYSQGIGSYYPYPSDEDMRIPFEKGVFESLKVVRAFGKFQSVAFIDEKEVLVLDASGWVESHSYRPGEVVQRLNRETLIAARDGFILIRFVESE
jgi:methionyl-tRNA formyltransferase